MNGTEIINNVKKRGYILINGCYWPPDSPKALLYKAQTAGNTSKKESRLKRLKTGWIDDTLNIKNKDHRFDPFITMVRMDLALDIWPEFYFTTTRQYRFDYAIPIHNDGRLLKIAIECDGGTQAHGNSGHSSPAGIARDMHKGTLAAVEGWTLIRCTPKQLCTSGTIALINQALNNIL